MLYLSFASHALFSPFESINVLQFTRDLFHKANAVNTIALYYYTFMAVYIEVVMTNMHGR